MHIIDALLPWNFRIPSPNMLELLEHFDLHADNMLKLRRISHWRSLFILLSEFETGPPSKDTSEWVERKRTISIPRAKVLCGLTRLSSGLTFHWQALLLSLCLSLCFHGNGISTPTIQYSQSSPNLSLPALLHPCPSPPPPPTIPGWRGRRRRKPARPRRFAEMLWESRFVLGTVRGLTLYLCSV